MLDFVADVVMEYRKLPREAITEETDFVQDLHMNSYDFVSLISRLENRLGIEAPDDELGDLRTVGDVARYLQRKVS